MRMFTDPASGRRYVVDPATGQSRWAEPPPPMPPSVQPSMPPSWQPPLQQGPVARPIGRGARAWLWGAGALVTLAVIGGVGSLVPGGSRAVQPLADGGAKPTAGGPSSGTSLAASASPTGGAAPAARRSTAPPSTVRVPAAKVSGPAGPIASVTPKVKPKPARTATPGPATRQPAKGPAPAGGAGAGCDPNYSGACVPVASDVDCAGGKGNGPAYVRGPVRVIGTDIYRLDADHDGIGCE